MGKVSWTERANQNLEDIFNYIAKNSEFYAHRLVRSIIAATLKLEKMPYIGRCVPEFETRDIRELIHQNYRIVYRVVEGTEDVEILAIIHGARDFKSLYRG